MPSVPVSPRRRAFQVFLATVALFLLFAGGLAFWFSSYPDGQNGSASGVVDVRIARGATARQVSETLAAAGLITNPTLFRLYAGQRGVASRFKAGHYRIAAPSTPRALIEQLVKGAADELLSVTVPEGKNMVEVAELFQTAGIASRDALLRLMTSAEFAASLSLPGKSVEGYLFPDTYKFRPESDPDRVVVALVRRHREVFEALRGKYAEGWARLSEQLGWGDREVVIMASIVEKETGDPEERPRIAQVFINRLLFPTFTPKLLQTDPTIVYGCTVAPRFFGPASAACREFAGRIRRIHLDDKDNPFSTYAHTGLPPGPIANPGRLALTAVMNPDGSKYLYFVAKDAGTHQFSATRAEHEAAVVKYQRGGKPLSASP